MSGIFQRAHDIVQAKANKALDAAEKPDEMLDLSYEKMLTGLQDTKHHLADVVAQQKSLEHQIDAGQNEVQKAEDDARMALKAGREDLAKAALAHKHSALEKLAALHQAHDAIRPQADKLIGYMKKLEERIDDFRLKKEVTKSSYAAAQAQVEVSQSMVGIGTNLNNVGDTVRRADDKVAGMRAKADAMDGLIESGVLTDPLDTRAKSEKELDTLRIGSAIDSDLAAMKAEIAGETPLRIGVDKPAG
jgi:phage shock protein A